MATLRAAGCVYAEDEARLLLDAATDDADLARMVAERVAGTPLELVVGWAEFCGLRIVVAPGVFVPRQRTGALVRPSRRGLRRRRRRRRPLLRDRRDRRRPRGERPGPRGATPPTSTRTQSPARGATCPPERVHRGRPLRRAAGRRSVAGSRGGRQRAVRPDRRDRADAARGARPRAPDRPRRRRRTASTSNVRVIAGAPDWLAPGGRVLVETSRGAGAGTAPH